MPDLVEPVIGSSALELLELASLLLALESEADLPDLPEDSLTGLSVGLAVIGLDVVGLAVFQILGVVGLAVIGLGVVGLAVFQILGVVGLAVIGLDVVGLDVTGLTVGPTVGFMDER